MIVIVNLFLIKSIRSEISELQRINDDFGFAVIKISPKRTNNKGNLAIAVHNVKYEHAWIYQKNRVTFYIITHTCIHCRSLLYFGCHAPPVFPIAGLLSLLWAGPTLLSAEGEEVS